MSLLLRDGDGTVAESRHPARQTDARLLFRRCVARFLDLVQSGVRVLEDSVFSADNITIIGRRDSGEKERADISDLIKNIPTENYTIVLDHQPNDYDAEGATGVLNIVLNFGVKFDYMQYNPLTKVGTFKNSNAIRKEMEVYTPEQWKLYRRTALEYSTANDKLDFYVFFNIAYYTGLRKGEIHALRWSAINDGFLTVRTSIAQRTAQDVETPPKNRRSERSIEMPTPLQNVLCDHLKRVCGDPFFTRDKFVCGFDRPLRNTSLDVYNRTVAQLAGLPRLRIHDFRHTHASTLINAGVPVIEISKRLGHSSIEQTLETYSHLFKSTSKLSIDVLNNIE